MFGFIKKAFYAGLKVWSSINLLSATPLSAAPLNVIPLNATSLGAAQLKCISITYQECKVRPEIIKLIVMRLCFYYNKYMEW